MFFKIDLIKFLQNIWLWKGNRLWTWVESALVTGIILGLCYVSNPKNILYLREVFPWPWLASIIIVLQYGLGPALFSAFLIISIAFFAQDSSHFTMFDFQSYTLSGISLLIVCAVFSSSWLRRTINAEELLVYTNERLESLTNSYYMLRLSYDYLEHNIITKPYTLRKVMIELQQVCVAYQGILTPEISYRFLQTLVQYCAVNSAGIYLYEGKNLNSTPVAEIGPAGILDLDDPLIRQTIETQSTNYVSLNNLEHANECNYLAAFPMTSSEGVCLGFVVIKDMSFWTLNDEMLTTLSVLIAYFVEEISIIKINPQFFSIFPSCPSDFARQFKKLMHLQKTLQIDSALCAVIVPKEFRPYSVIEHLKKQRRFLDVMWDLHVGDKDVLITLVPFTDATGVYGFLNRIDKFLKVTMGLSYTAEQIQMRSMQLYNTEPVGLLSEFMDFIGLPERVE